MKTKASTCRPKATADTDCAQRRKNLPRSGPTTNELSSGGIPLLPPPGRQIILGSAAQLERIKVITCGGNVSCLTEGLPCCS